MNWSGEKETKKQFKKQMFVLSVFLGLDYSISNPDGDSENALKRRNIQNFQKTKYNKPRHIYIYTYLQQYMSYIQTKMC